MISKLIPADLKPGLKNIQRLGREARYSASDIGLKGWAKFKVDRLGKVYQSAFDTPRPLVSVCIATYNRGPLLIERSLRSIMAQTYENIEILVVGDACTDNTAELMSKVSDPRVKFTNLSSRGDYPSNPVHRWMVAGTKAMNHALQQARGEFVTHLDDDDEHLPDRLEKLVAMAQAKRAEVIWHPFLWEDTEFQWQTNWAEKFAFQKVSTSSIFYHRWFKSIPWNINAWQTNEPGDWNRLRKFRFLGANALRHPEVLLRHFRERNQNKPSIA